MIVKLTKNDHNSMIPDVVDVTEWNACGVHRTSVQYDRCILYVH